MRKVAIIGTGIMGHGMAVNFLRRDHEVVVWNRNKDKVKDLLEQGATLAKSPKVATNQADIVFEVTANDESSRAVWLNEDGIMAGADATKILITCATLSLAWTDELAKICAEKELTFLDMPMTGGRMGAESGQLVFLVGGAVEKLKAVESSLQAVSNKILHFGPVGSGMRYKLILNMLQAIHVAGLGEALHLAQSLGLNLEKVGDALAERPGGITTNLAWQCFKQEPSPINFSVEWITKDLTYAKQAATGLNTPLLNETLTRYRHAIKQGLDQADWTAINKLD